MFQLLYKDMKTFKSLSLQKKSLPPKIQTTLHISFGTEVPKVLVSKNKVLPKALVSKHSSFTWPNTWVLPYHPTNSYEA